MTHAELLRKHAVDAANEGGIWFSGEYMGMLASVAESIEAENEKLRELVRELWHELDATTQYDAGGGRGVVYEFADRMRELGIEVEE